MKVRLAAAVAAVLLLGCGFTSKPQPQTQPEPERPAPATTATNPQAKATTPQAKATTKAAKTGTLSSRSTAQTRQRVSCSDIQTELQLVAANGLVTWTSRVVEPGGSVTVTPATGTLAAGASVVVRIRGTYPADRRTFSVKFEYETNVGSAGIDFDINC
ncbi:hypothetical protein ACQP00_28325 [Dactylosporangium sp. CS-047395]|uniref:hypothetical protein n=1 Tax=Dactylosporangium sp. CS-047395 TaxID=3239936 RepID=UPI003D93E959